MKRRNMNQRAEASAPPKLVLMAGSNDGNDVNQDGNDNSHHSNHGSDDSNSYHSGQDNQTTDGNKIKLISIAHVVNPKPFYGNTDNADEWLMHLDVTCRSNGWDEKTKLEKIPLCLKQTAEAWYISEYGSDGIPSYNDFKLRFKKAFGFKRPAMVNFNSMTNRVQHMNENVMQYYYNKLLLIDRYNRDLKEEEKIQFIIRGLKPEYLKKIYSSQCTTLDSLVDKLKLLQESSDYASHQSEVTMMAYNQPSQAYQQNNFRYGQNRSFGNPNPTNNTNNWNQRQNNQDGRNWNRGRYADKDCFYCKKKGHIAVFCRKRMRDTEMRNGQSDRQNNTQINQQQHPNQQRPENHLTQASAPEDLNANWGL